ncbi:MAG TPA: HAD family hydrolase [Candidatus Paceibacterota bacterium]
MKKRIGVLFDFDGTLFDSMRVTYEATCSVFDHCGLPHPTFEDYCENFGLPYVGFYHSRNVSLSPEKIWEIFIQRVDYTGCSLFDDVHSTLISLTVAYKTEVVVGLVSGNRDEPVREYCVKHKVMGYMRYFVTKAHDKVPPIQNFCTEHSLLPADVWFIGDFGSDMRDARKAGVNAVGITRGKATADALMKAGADHCIAHLPELSRILPLER